MPPVLTSTEAGELKQINVNDAITVVKSVTDTFNEANTNDTVALNNQESS